MMLEESGETQAQNHLRLHAVVLNWRDPAATISCVDSILRTEMVERIWLIDNQSDGLLRPVGRMNGTVSIVELAENRGFAAGVNVGLRRALVEGAEAILVINNDAELCAGSLRILVEEMSQEPETGMTAPRILDSTSGETHFGAFLTPTGKVVPNLSANQLSNFLTWACVLVSGSALRAVGLLDERYFMYWEDVEFSCRLRANGFTLRVASEAQVNHATSSSHQRAGSVIAMYSVAGLITFARSQVGLLRVSCRIRAVARIVRAVIKLDFDQVIWLLRGVRLGRGSANPVFPKVNEILDSRQRRMSAA